MSYMALYRKFRPQTFEQVKGQDHVVRTLKNQIKNNRIGHAYLFSGTRGTGKTSVAKLFAKAVNCLDSHDGEPCGKCENCLAIARDSFMDVVEVDAASNTGVDDIRRIIEEVRYSPAKGKYKVYIIDEAHMLSGPAFNAFLKTLEEPPAYAVFILATTEAHKLPITILSRCQRYDFHRIETETIAKNLSELLASEGVEAEEKAVRYIARMGDGSMRDAISLLDKCIAFSLGEKMTYDMVLSTLGTVDTESFSRTFRAVYKGDVATALKEIEDSAQKGGDISRFVSDFLWYLRNLLLIKAAPSTDPEILGVSNENMDILRKDAQDADEGVLMRYIRVMSELSNDLRNVSSRQILVEVAFIKLARPEMETDNASLADRIRHLEDKISKGEITSAPRMQAESAPAKKEPVSSAFEQEEALPDISFERFETPQGAAPEPLAAPVNIEVEEISGHELDMSQSEGATAAQAACISWNGIVASIDSPPVRIILKKAQIRETEPDRVQIYGIDGINYTKIKESASYIEKTIEAYTGQKVTVEVKEGKADVKAAKAPYAAAPAKENRPVQAAPVMPQPATEEKKQEGDFDELLRSINFNVRMEDD